MSVKAIEEISRGYSAKAPLKENENIECRYCPYKSLCDIEDITREIWRMSNWKNLRKERKWLKNRMDQGAESSA